MVDYYEELNLNQQDSIADLNRTLSQLESTWKRREINNPEKATKILAIILEARNAFKSDAAKAEYDRNLAESKKPPEQIDYDAERKAQFQKYRKQVEKYFCEDQMDLALEAMRRAQQYYDPNQPDASYSYLCSLIKYGSGDYQGALSDVTAAIVTDGNNATYYRWKGDILGDFFNSAISDPNGLQTARSYLAQNRSNYEKALEVANRAGDKDEQIMSLEGLAESYALMYDSDYDRAERYANQALAMGDNSPELKEILETIRQGKAEFQPYQGKNHPSSSSGGGCYIATAVYGSYDCPEVWTLRRYRDYNLARTVIGRIFIKIYYSVSPVMVKLFGKTRWFNHFWRHKLDRIVKELNGRGYSSERYFD